MLILRVWGKKQSPVCSVLAVGDIISVNGNESAVLTTCLRSDSSEILLVDRVRHILQLCAVESLALTPEHRALHPFVLEGSLLDMELVYGVQLFLIVEGIFFLNYYSLGS